MNRTENQPPRRVLIASGNPLFGKGLHRLIAQRWGQADVEIRLVVNTAEALALLEEWRPDLVIIDYDDVHVDRAEFLNVFVTGEQPMQVMLVSLQASGGVVVYDRRTLTPAQAGDWLNLPRPPQPEITPTRRERSSPMRHFVIAGILVAVVAVITYLLLVTIGILPEQASAEAVPIDRLFEMHFVAVSFLFALITVLMVYSLIVFRRKRGDESDGRHIKGSTRLEIFWTIIPLVTVLYFSYIGSVILADTQKNDPQALVIEVVGGQWYWTYTYPDFNFTTNELYLPVDRTALLKLRSMDVIHSFWVPEFRVKQDVLPGENFVRELEITPTRLGDFQVLCAELCGLQHAYMVSPVHVVTQADFDSWVDEQMSLAQADPATRGQIIAQNAGCLSCHSVDGTERVGPTWLGLYESEQVLQSGETVEVEEGYLFTAIVDPNMHIPQGFPPNVMPQNYGEMLTNEQIFDIIEYIESLR